MQEKQKQECTLIWFRNDLRVRDNKLLKEAIATKRYLVAFYAFDPVFFKRQYSFERTGKFRLRFLIETVKELKESLAKYNIPFYVGLKKTETVVREIQNDFLITTLVYQEDETSDEKDIEKRVRKVVGSKVKKIRVTNQYLYEPHQIDTLFNKKYPLSFSSFRNKVEKKLDIDTELNYHLPYQDIYSQVFFEIPNCSCAENVLGNSFPFKGGEKQALVRLKSYFFETKKVIDYKKTRNNLLGINCSTKFSPWLSNGSISVKTIYKELKRFEDEYEANSSTYWVYFELLWREFFKHAVRYHKNNFFKLGGIQKKTILSIHDNKVIKNWVLGNTTSDFVNANMIELRKTGWMSNRGRQNVASYFVHNLQQDWRIGAAYFESLLVDYDPHSNYGNWMYIAGVGNSSESKKFDIEWQANTYDKYGEFRAKWIDK